MSFGEHLNVDREMELTLFLNPRPRKDRMLSGTLRALNWTGWTACQPRVCACLLPTDLMALWW